MHVLPCYTLTNGHVDRNRGHGTHGLILVSYRDTRQQQHRLNGHLIISTSSTSITKRGRAGHIRHLRRTSHSSIHQGGGYIERYTIIIASGLLPRLTAVLRNRRTIEVRRSARIRAVATRFAPGVYNAPLFIRLVGVHRPPLTTSRSSALRTDLHAYFSHIVRNLL